MSNCFEIGKSYFDNSQGEYLKVTDYNGSEYTCDVYWVHPCNEGEMISDGDLVKIDTRYLTRADYDHRVYEVIDYDVSKLQ